MRSIRFRLPLLLSGLVLTLGLGACHSASYQTVPGVDIEAPPTDVGRLVVLRAGGAWSRVPLKIFDGTKELASLAPGHYFAWDRPAGRFVGRLVLERPQWEGGSMERVYDVQVTSGMTRYVRVGADLEEGPKPELMEAEAALEALENSTPAEAR